MIWLLLLTVLGQAGAPAEDRPEGKPEGEFEVVQGPVDAEELACIEQADPAACLKAGHAWYAGGRTWKRNPLQAESLYRAGCGFGGAEACLAAGWMLIRGETGIIIRAPEGTVVADAGGAAQMFRVACKLGTLEGCGLWGDLLLDPRSLVPNDELGVRELERDPLLARQAYADGCNEGSFEGSLPESGALTADLRSCARLAEMYGHGVGVRKDAERQAYFLRRACRISGGERYCGAAKALTEELERQAAEPEPKKGNKDKKQEKGWPKKRRWGTAPLPGQ